MLINRSQTLDAIHSGFFGKTVLAVGDMRLDRYLWDEVSRISTEAPVPVIRLTQETENGGGAANIALNLAKLGAHTRIVTLTMRDDPTLAAQARQAGASGYVIKDNTFIGCSLIE